MLSSKIVFASVLRQGELTWTLRTLTGITLSNIFQNIDFNYRVCLEGKSSALFGYQQFSWFLFAMSPFSFHPIKETCLIDLRKLGMMNKSKTKLFTEAKSNFYKSLHNFNVKTTLRNQNKQNFKRTTSK